MIKKATFLVLVVSFAAGCGPSPSDVCSKLESLDALPMGGKVGCEIKWGEAKSQDADKYKKEAECVLAASKKEDLSDCSK